MPVLDNYFSVVEVSLLCLITVSHELVDYAQHQ
jgi:hypothetical protein